MMMTACGPKTLIDERTEQREPDGERGVQGDREDAVRGQQLVARHDLGDHRRLRGREEHRHGRDEDVQQQDQQEVVADEEQADDREATQDVRGDEDEPPIDPVDVDAGHRREQHGRHQERQDEQADRGVRLRRRHDDRQAEQHHVAADLGRRLRQPETQERGVAEDRQRALRVAGFGRLRRDHAGVDRSPVPVIGPRPRVFRPRPAAPAAGDRGVQRRVAAPHELDEAMFEASPAPAGRAGHRSGSATRCRPRAGPRARYRPRTGGSGEAAGRRRAAGSGRVAPARRTGYQSRGRPCPGTSSRSVAGTSTRSSGRDLHDDVGQGRRELRDDAARSGQRARELVRARRSPGARTGRRAGRRRP